MVWTSPADEEALLGQVDDLGDHTRVIEVGRSAGDRPVRLVVFGTGNQADVMFLCAQHGNEPAGREAALRIFADYVDGDQDTVDLFDGLTVIFFPSANPDGTASNNRRNDANADLNREWLELREPEARAVAEVMRDWKPRAAIDLHEILGSPTGFTSHVEYRATDHRMGHPSTRQLGLELRDQLIQLARDNGEVSGPYLGPVSPLNNFDGASILRHQISLIVETNRHANYDPDDRVAIHRRTIEHILGWITDRYDVIGGLRNQAEQWAIEQGIEQAPVWNGSSYIHPVPSGYRLSPAVQHASAWHRSVFLVHTDSDATIPMVGPWWSILPFLFDPGSGGPFVGTRLYDDGGTDPPPDDEDDEEPEPEPEYEFIAVAAVQPHVTWLSCDAISGQILEEIPQVSGSIGRTLGAYTSHSLTVGMSPSRILRPEHQMQSLLRATEPARAMIVAVINDLPAWGGLVMARTSGTSESIEVSCVTTEGYLDRRIVADHRWANADQNNAARTLILDATTNSGLDIDVTITNSQHRRRLIYERTERTSVYRALTELSGLDNGPEWTIDLDWANSNQTRVARVARVADRIGRSTPAATFDTRGGSATDWTLAEDISDGRYATWVEVYGQGEGDDQPSSDPAIAQQLVSAGVPVYEHHAQMESNTRGELNTQARALRDRLMRGSRVWTITTRWDQYPRFGVDWVLGDQVSFELAGRRFPDGITEQGRIIGWELDLAAGTISLTLYNPLENVTA